MRYDYDNTRWQNDINRFARYQEMFRTFTSDWGKEHLRKRMHEIQQRWPQYIKIDEIP